MYKQENLTKAIDEAIKGRGIRQDLRHMCEKKYMLTLDGNAAKRIVDIVESFNNKKMSYDH